MAATRAEVALLSGCISAAAQLMRVNVFASVCWLCLNRVKHLLTYFRAEHFPFANWEFSSHRFSSPLPERVYFSEQAAIGMAVAKKAAGCWEVAGWGMMCADGNRWWFILETCWATSTLHVPFCRPIAERGPLWLGPVCGGQMVPFGEGPQHRGLCSWGSTRAAKNKHGLLLLGTFRSFSLWDLMDSGSDI